MFYLAVDPGNSTGIAGFDEQGQLMYKKILRSLDDFMEWLSEFETRPEDWPKVVICEDYRIFAKRAKSHIGSQVPTVQVIGMLKREAKRWKAEFVLQPSSILSIAVLWSGVSLPSQHDISHDIAAYNHGVYYLISHGIIENRLKKEAK
jgi:hypothetical protein